MDKVNFTLNQVVEVVDYNRLGLYSESGVKDVIKAISCTTSGDVLFKNLFPTTTFLHAGTLTVTSVWAQAMGVGIRGVPGVVGSSSASAVFAAPSIGGTTIVHVIFERVETDLTENRVSMTSAGVRTIVPFVVSKLSSFIVKVVDSSYTTTNDTIVWQTLTFVNPAGTVLMTSLNNTSLLYHAL